MKGVNSCASLPKINSYIGLLELHFCCEESFLGERLPHMFGECGFGSHVIRYDLAVHASGHLDPSSGGLGEAAAEFDDFVEFLGEGCITRFYFLPVNGERVCYARTRLCGRSIDVCFDESVPWRNGRRQKIWEFILLEKLLAAADAFILHSASIVYEGKALLFSAPSGTGKSTQANLWKKLIPGTVGFNGDRNLLVKQDGVWYVCGLPWHGTSPDCENGVVPLAGIALLEQAAYNSVKELSEKEKFVGVFSGITQNPWDKECTLRQIDAVNALVREVPVCRLSCTKDAEAVSCLKSWLKKNETI